MENAELDFRVLFEGSPDILLVLLPDDGGRHRRAAGGDAHDA